MHVAIYARHSSDKQTTSTEDQIARCIEFCKRSNYVVADIFRDEAISGAHLSNRPGMHALAEAALKLRFTRIIAEDLSRFSRDQSDTASFYKRMTFLGISIETLAEGPINDLHIGFKGTMNALYLKDLADKTKRGQKAAVERGSVPGRTYGYDIVFAHDHKGEQIRGLRKINDVESEVVREIFKLYRDGRTLKEICDELNRRQVPAPRGPKWAPSTLIGTASRKTGMLRQTLYKGEIVFNRMSYRKHPDTGRRVSTLNPESEWLRVEAPELAIMSADEFDAVQRLIEERSSVRQKRILENAARSSEERHEKHLERRREIRANQFKELGSVHYLFSGRLYCAQHGTKITKVASPNRYACPKRLGCRTAGKITLAQIMGPVIAALSKVSHDEIKVHFESDENIKLRESARRQCEDLTAQIETMEKKLFEKLDLLHELNNGESVRKWIKEKEVEIARCKLDLETTRRILDSLSLPARSVEATQLFQRMATKLASDPYSQPIHKLFRPFIQQITLHRVPDRSKKTQRYADVELDYAKLVQWLALDRGENRWKTSMSAAGIDLSVSPA